MLEPILTIGIGSVLTVLLAFMAVRLSIALRRFTIKKTSALAEDIPSVSVCIPARNETHALAECLERVLASDYPKIEIVVFDDNSDDNTSMLVRSFAHAGVRFVPGVPLPDGWLGKNHALSILAREASGSKVVFLDVDTKVGPTTISQLVGYSAAEAVDMVSVLPLQRDHFSLRVLFTPLRYLWEVLLSGRQTPATTSAVWLIDRDVLLDECGGFTTYAGDIRPEQRLAERLGTKRYHFLLGSRQLNVYQEKKWSSQLETSRRLLYPMVGSAPVNALGAIFLLLFMNLPLVGVVFALANRDTVFGIWFAALSLGFSLLYGVYCARVRLGGAWVAAIVWPFVVVQEIYLLVASVIGYMTNTITWKGRLVTAPVMQDDYIVIDK